MDVPLCGVVRHSYDRVFHCAFVIDISTPFATVLFAVERGIPRDEKLVRPMISSVVIAGEGTYNSEGRRCILCKLSQGLSLERHGCRALV